MKPSNYDFSGWATKNDILCSDGRTIRRNAFKECDGMKVPLVYNHDHEHIDAVIGHALLENRDEGVYCYGFLNKTPLGQNTKLQLANGDITNMSIYANKLQHAGHDVIHGMIREVSLVLAGANPGAKIEYVLSHGDDMFELEEAQIYTDENLVLSHSDMEEDEQEDDKMDENSKSPKEIFDAMTEEQKNAVYAIVGLAVDNAKKEMEHSNIDDEDEEHEDEEYEDEDEEYEDEDEEYEEIQEDEEVKHNVFESDYYEGETLSHAETAEIFDDMKRFGTLSESCLQHGITDIDVMFPDAKAISNDPSLIARDMDWVSKVLNSTHHTPFSRVKSIHANITADEARARGYIKGNEKVEEVITALKRVTTPQTIYKKQALDRDDIIDITDFNVVAFLKSEMRIMLNEELARAILVGDGRATSSPDKINPLNIRPVWDDNALYTVTKTVVKDANAAKNFIKTCIRARKDYKGSGNPVLFTSEDMLTDMLLIEDGIGRPLYDTVEKLKTALRVSDIVTVPVFEGLTKTVDGTVHTLGGIIVNLRDYNVGADNGGSVSMFEDFDIDYNKEKYLIETRCSGALTIPYSAIAIDFVPATSGADEDEQAQG